VIGLYDDSDNRLPITYNGITFNSASESADEILEVGSVQTFTQYQAVVEQRNDERDGSEAFRPRKPIRVVRLADVVMRAPTIGEIYDRLNMISAALDPVLVRRSNPTVEGFIALNFTTPREGADLACKYLARPRAMPEPVLSKFLGDLQADFSVEFLLKDPRRYAQAQSSRSGSGTATNNGNYPTWPTVTITMSGAGNAAYSIDKSGDTETALVLDLSGRSNGDVIVVDMENRAISLNGTLTPSLYVSGGFFDLGPGANTITVSNGTNATTSTTWYDAYAA
jgi:hypothetical protein